MTNPVYIRSAACISPRQGEPDYRTLLDPKMLRRMSRVIRMGAAAALTCLDSTVPDAIITGTAYGCLEDTGVFLNGMIERKEETLQPASFIQSTHNTVGAQIALLLQCTGYNNTFVHRGFSFESALLDAVMLLSDEEARTVLVGGIDEITATSLALLSRFGLYRHTTPGEGAAFFLLAADPSDSDYARLDDFKSFYQPATAEEVKREMLSFLQAHALTARDLDLVVTGDNGDRRGDAIYREICVQLFPDVSNLTYKQLSGEYPTSASFGLWMAANEVRSGAGRVLLYNHYLGSYHSIYLLSHVAK